MIHRFLRPSSRQFSTKPSRVLFFGTDDFSLPSLERLHTLSNDPLSSIKSIDVVTTSDVRRTPKAKPTPVPVKRFALENNLTVHEIPPGLSPLQLEDNWSLPSSIAKFDLGVVVSFGYFLPKSIISSFTAGAINVHPSLLPKYRGAAPITWSMLRDDDTTGISIIEVDPNRFDQGNILLQMKEDIHPDEMYNELRERLSVLGADCLQASIRNLELGMRPNVVQSNGSEGSDGNVKEQTPTWKLTTRHGRVRFTTPYNNKISKRLKCGSLNLNDAPTSRELYNRWRALSESVGVWVDWKIIKKNTPTTKIVELRLIEIGPPETFEWKQNLDDLAVGSMIWCSETKRIMLKCAAFDDSDWTSDRGKQYVEIKKLQIPGKKVLNSIDFANGQRLKKSPVQVLK